ncbi:hypothetical protein [Streptomyces sp. NPDC054849]
MATPQDIARVAAELEEAENTVDSLKRKRYISPAAGAAYSAAKGRIELATQELERLNAEYEAEQQALAGRPDLEKAAGKDITAAQKQLEASRQTLTEALTRAQQGLAELTAAAGAHNALIERHSAALAVRGLRLEDEHEHQTGGGPKGARIRGTWWTPVEPTSLLVWVMHRVASAALPERHQLIGSLKFAYGRYLFERQAADLLAGVPELPRRQLAPQLRPEVVDMRPPAYIQSVQLAKEEISRQLQGYTQPKQAPDGTWYSDRCEAPDTMKEQVRLQLEKLDADVKSGRVVARYK